MESVATKPNVVRKFPVIVLFFEQVNEVRNFYQLDKVAELISIQRDNLTTNLHSPEFVFSYYEIRREIQMLDSLLRRVQQLRIQFNLGRKEQTFSLPELREYIDTCKNLDQLNRAWEFLPKTITGKVDTSTKTYACWEARLGRLYWPERPKI